ncbi:cupin-like domain-containing protein [Chytriomyces sp. MP71]|nr:cupin-like domain-containing protein [Chytriomyces sp. MP71]
MGNKDKKVNKTKKMAVAFKAAPGSGSELGREPRSEEAANVSGAHLVDADDVEEEDDEDDEYEYEDDEDDEEEERPVSVRYAGFEPPKNANWTPNRINASYPPHLFFQHYVATRTPVIITGLPQDSQWTHSKVFSAFKNTQGANNQFKGVDALAAAVGKDAVVEVETRAEDGNFGTGRKRMLVRFQDFVDAVKEGDTSIYLSTQYSNQDEEEDQDDELDEDYHPGHHGLDDEDDDDDEMEDDEDEEDEDDEEEDEEMDQYDEEDNNEDNHVEDEHVHGPDCSHGGDHDPVQQIDLLETYNEFVKAPLHRLLNDIPLRPQLLPTLIPQQVNLWMGAAPPAGVSSGLHHDFADNLYALLQGGKRVTLLPPSAAPHLALYGEDDLAVVHENGLVCYDWGVGSDGSFALDVARWKWKVALNNMKEGLKEAKAGQEVDLEALRKELEEARDELELIEEEMGEFDAHMHGDDEDDEAIDEDEAEGRDDGDEPLFGDKDGEADTDDDAEEDGEGDMEIDEEELQNLRDDYEAEGDEEEDEPPLSFSRISSDVLHSKDGHEQFPGLSDVTKVTFDLKEGEMLYIPASWFHEVQSTPGNKKAAGPHVAFNYWFHPPNALDAKDYENPYKTDYWAEHWETLDKLINESDTPQVHNNSAATWNKLRKGADGELKVVDEARSRTEADGTLREYEDYDSVPRALKLAFKHPGAWFMRNRQGKFLGRARRATKPESGV